MSDIVLTVYAMNRPSGVDLVTNKTTVVATTNNYLMPNDGNTRLYVNNTVGTTCIVTITTPGTVDSNAIADPTVSIATGKAFLLPPLPTNIYNNASDQVQFVFDKAVDIIAVRG